MSSGRGEQVGVLAGMQDAEAVGDRADGLAHEEEETNAATSAVARASTDSSLANTCRQPWIM